MTRRASAPQRPRAEHGAVELAVPAGPRPRSFAAALPLATAAGLALAASFPGPALWPLALAAPALLVLAVEGRRFLGGVGLGLVAGLAFYGPLVAWSSRFLGPVPWAALATTMALSFALGAGLIALATRWIPIRFPGRAGRFGMLPLAIACLWTLREAVASTWPYGGFAWGRIAQSQSNGPLVELVAWLGLSAMGAVLVWWSVLALEIARRLLARRRALVRAAAPADAAAVALAPVVALAALAVVPAVPLPSSGTIRIAAVQGDTPEAGYFAHGERGDVLRAHLAATRSLVPADAGVDAILWPEGSGDLSPEYSSFARRELTALSSDYGAPIIANTVTVTGSGDDERYFNTQFAFDAAGGWRDAISKQHPVPFGEYIPDRDFFYALAPDLIGLVSRGYSPGPPDVILDVAGARAGTLICFDVIDDAAVRLAVNSGAELLILPTNNADFDRTDEAAQQLSFARMRAVETGLAAVQVSTVGMSAAYDGSGRPVAELPWFEPGAMILDVPLASGRTPAMLLGSALEQGLCVLGLVLLIGSGDAARRRERTAREARG